MCAMEDCTGMFRDFRTMIDLFFPVGYITLFILGIVLVGIFIFAFGFLSFCIFLFLTYIGVIRIQPLLDLLYSTVKGTSFEKMCKRRIKQTFVVEENCKDSGPVGEQCIYMFHPHGAFCTSFFFHQFTSFTNWPGKRKRGKPVILERYYWIPFAKEILETFQAIPNGYKTMEAAIEKGESLSLLPGGLGEMRNLQKNKLRVNIVKRKGIFRLALKHGIPLVPVLTYGENELFHIIEGKGISLLQDICECLGFLLVFPTWRTLNLWWKMLRNGLERPIQSVIGKSIQVEKQEKITESDIFLLKQRYIAELRRLYAETKPEEYDDELEFV
jgi:hypothetical protein